MRYILTDKKKEIMGRNVQKQSIRILIPKKIPKSSHASGFTVISNLEESIILPFSSSWINYPLGNFTAFQRFILKKMLVFHTNHASFLFLIHLFIHPFNQQILVECYKYTLCVCVCGKIRKIKIDFLSSQSFMSSEGEKYYMNIQIRAQRLQCRGQLGLPCLWRGR